MNARQRAAVEALGDIVAEFYIEADKWPDARCGLIRDQAFALDGIRVRTILDLLTVDEAFAWLEAARLVLANTKVARVKS